MKSIRKILNNRNFILLILLSFTVICNAQITHPGTDEGLPTPVDGGILMAILGLAGLVTMYFKKKKKDS